METTTSQTSLEAGTVAGPNQTIVDGLASQLRKSALECLPIHVQKGVEATISNINRRLNSLATPEFTSNTARINAKDIWEAKRIVGESSNNLLPKLMVDMQYCIYLGVGAYDAQKRKEAKEKGQIWVPSQSLGAAIIDVVEAVTEETRVATSFKSTEAVTIMAFKAKVQLLHDVGYIGKTQCERLADSLEQALANGTVPLGLYNDSKDGVKLMAFDAPWLGMA